MFDGTVQQANSVHDTADPLSPIVSPLRAFNAQGFIIWSLQSFGRRVKANEP